MPRPHLLVAVVAAACSSPSADDDVADAAPRGDAIADAAGAAGYCEATADAFCDFYLRCGRMLADDPAECRAIFLEACDARYEPRYLDLVAAGLLSLSADGIDACAAHLATVACDAQPLDLGGPCGDMWIGHQPVGGACGLDVESFVCAAGATCVLDLSLCGRCEAAAPLGGDCAGELRCGDEAYCDGEACVARGGPGADCATAPCAAGLRCVDDACAAPTYVGEGDGCDAQRRCPYRSTCIDGACRRDALLGDACGSGARCASGRCAADRCEPFAGAGEACDAAADCASGQCGDDGRCAPLPGACFADP